MNNFNKNININDIDYDFDEEYDREPADSCELMTRSKIFQVCVGYPQFIINLSKLAPIRGFHDIKESEIIGHKFKKEELNRFNNVNSKSIQNNLAKNVFKHKQIKSENISNMSLSNETIYLTHRNFGNNNNVDRYSNISQSNINSQTNSNHDSIQSNFKFKNNNLLNNLLNPNSLISTPNKSMSKLIGFDKDKRNSKIYSNVLEFETDLSKINSILSNDEEDRDDFDEYEVVEDEEDPIIKNQKLVRSNQYCNICSKIKLSNNNIIRKLEKSNSINTTLNNKKIVDNNYRTTVNGQGNIVINNIFSNNQNNNSNNQTSSDSDSYQYSGKNKIN